MALVNPPSPSTVHAELQETPKSQKQKLALSLTQVTQFLLSPHSTQPVQPTSNSIFARALSVLKNHRPSHSNSFTLSRIPVTTNTPLSPPPPYVGTPGTPAEISQTSTANLSVAPPPPVLVFHDRTPVLTVRSLTGLIEIDRTEEQLLGVETSFWIAVALTYLEFLEERGVSRWYVFACQSFAEAMHLTELSGCPRRLTKRVIHLSLAIRVILIM